MWSMITSETFSITRCTIKAIPALAVFPAREQFFPEKTNGQAAGAVSRKPSVDSIPRE